VKELCIGIGKKEILREKKEIVLKLLNKETILEDIAEIAGLSLISTLFFSYTNLNC
jgi:hypothetical protein